MLPLYVVNAIGDYIVLIMIKMSNKTLSKPRCANIYSKELKKRMRRCDWFIGCAFVFMILIRVFTTLYISSVSQATNATISSIAIAYEANPLAKLLLNMSGSKYILMTLLLPAVTLATYAVFRKKVKENKMEVQQLEWFSYIMFLVTLLNMISDWCNFVGKLL